MDLFRTSGETIARLAITAAIFPLAVFGREPTAARAMETFKTPGMTITRMMRRNAHGKRPTTTVMPDEQAIFDVISETCTRLRDAR